MRNGEVAKNFQNDPTQTFVSRRNAACWYDEGTQRRGGTPITTIYYSHYAFRILSLFHTTQWHFIPHKHTNMLIHASSFFIVWPNESQTKQKKKEIRKKTNTQRVYGASCRSYRCSTGRNLQFTERPNWRKTISKRKNRKKLQFVGCKHIHPKKKTKIMFGLQLHKTRQANTTKRIGVSFFFLHLDSTTKKKYLS